jgi:hypothetical protein
MSGQKHTAVFVGRLPFQEMGPTAVKRLFNTQKNSTASLNPTHDECRPILTRALTKQHVLEKSIRKWTENLTDSRGKLMQCDVVNGGKDWNAYLLANCHHSKAVKIALKEYKERVHPFKH